MALSVIPAWYTGFSIHSNNIRHGPSTSFITCFSLVRSCGVFSYWWSDPCMAAKVPVTLCQAHPMPRRAPVGPTLIGADNIMDPPSPDIATAAANALLLETESPAASRSKFTVTTSKCCQVRVSYRCYSPPPQCPGTRTR